MISKVKLPKLDANMEEATVGNWFKEEGDSVKKGEILLEIVTDKAVFEFESPKSGILRQIVAPTNSVLPAGYIIALIGKDADDLPDVSSENQEILSQAAENAPEADLAASGPMPKRDKRSGSSDKVRATPSAKRLAKEHGVELADIQKAFGGKVVKEKMVLEYVEKGK